MRFLIAVASFVTPLVAQSYRWQGEYNVNAFNEKVGKPTRLYSYAYAGSYSYVGVTHNRRIKIAITPNEILFSPSVWIGDNHQTSSFSFAGSNLLIRTNKGVIKLTHTPEPMRKPRNKLDLKILLSIRKNRISWGLIKLTGKDRQRFIGLLMACSKSMKASVPSNVSYKKNIVFDIPCRGFNKLWRKIGWR